MISKLAMAVAAALLATTAQAQSLTLKGPNGQTATVTDAQLRNLHRLSVQTGWSDHHRYAGAPVSDLLALIGGLPTSSCTARPWIRSWW